MERTAILIVVLLALAAASAQAAFPGRNGGLVYGVHSEDIAGDSSGSALYDTWFVGMHVRPGNDATLAMCAAGPDFDCRDAQYSEPAASPDGRRMAMSKSGALMILDLYAESSGGELQLGRHGYAPTFSPDGQSIAFVSARGPDDELAILDLNSRQARPVTSDAQAPTWSTQGWIAFVGTRGICRIRPDGTGLRLLVADAYAPTWSPDGARLAFVRSSVVRNGRVVRRGGVFVRDVAGRRERRLTSTTRSSDPFDIAWSPDGRRLAIAGSDLTAVDLRGRRTRRIPSSFSAALDVTVDWQPLPR